MQHMTTCSEKSAPFETDLTERLPADSSQTTTTTSPHTSHSTTISNQDSGYNSLLPACYRTKDDDIIAFNLDDEHLSRELGVGRLNDVHEWLWLVGRPMPPRALHHQKLLGREIVLTERMDMHLVWADSRMFLKPLPRSLLSPQFWVDHLRCRKSRGCSSFAPERSGDSTTICEKEQLRQCALGFLMSFIALVSHESDFHIAQEARLLPRHISWLEWKRLVSEVLENIHSHGHINKRYIYGELRLSRLNAIYRLTRGSIRGYQPEYNNYSKFLNENLTWLISLLGYLVVILTAMQLGLQTRALQDDNAFQAVTYGFTVFAIVSPLVTIVSIFGLFLFLLVYNWIRTVHYGKARFAKLNAPLVDVKV